MSSINYKDIGFKAGLEIHQQLETHKLFCSCESRITEDIDYSFERVLRPTQSELGDIDLAALKESQKNKRFLYTASDKVTCLVEADEEPPHNVNMDAVDIALTMAVMLNARIIDEVHFMRKIVIDGSATSGFQRTALVAINGRIKDVGIQTIALEEDAARRITEKDNKVNYGLDRLCIPLVEIATSADIRDPEHARLVAEEIGLLFYATGRVKRGLGTIRQDLNISIKDGSRVEIKGIQSLSAISRVAEKEVLRQKGILEIKNKLHERVEKNDYDHVEIIDLTDLLQNTKSSVIINGLQRSKGCVKGVKLPGYNGLLRLPDTRIGRDLAVYARVSTGISGIIHSDELPGYGITEDEMRQIKDKLGCNDYDAFVIIVGDKTLVESSLRFVLERARLYYDGVPEEVRRSLPDDTTEYMRPMPGAARMYPETDIPPLRINKEYIERIKSNLPEHPEVKIKRLASDYKLNTEQIYQLMSFGYDYEFESLMRQHPKYKNTIIRLLINTLSELEKEGVLIDDNKRVMNLIDVTLKGLDQGLYAKEATSEILKYLIKNKDATLDKAIQTHRLELVDEEEIKEIIKKLVNERLDFIRQRGESALGPLMGVAMKNLRGRIDGQRLSILLEEEIKKVLKSK
ncbi:MAG: Glu-tRNA(Gln) amidotransferase subunit GatE [Candidatus Thermoplasmatota archaeon]